MGEYKVSAREIKVKKRVTTVEDMVDTLYMHVQGEGGHRRSQLEIGGNKNAPILDPLQEMDIGGTPHSPVQSAHLAIQERW